MKNGKYAILVACTLIVMALVSTTKATPLPPYMPEPTPTAEAKCDALESDFKGGLQVLIESAIHSDGTRNAIAIGPDWVNFTEDVLLYIGQIGPDPDNPKVEVFMPTDVLSILPQPVFESEITVYVGSGYTLEIVVRNCNGEVTFSHRVLQPTTPTPPIGTRNIPTV